LEWKDKLKQIFRLKNLLPISLIAVVAAVFLRIIQLNVAIDFTTGFFNKQTVIVPLLTVLILVYLAYSVAVLIYHPIRMDQPYRPEWSIPSVVIAGVTGIVLVVEGVTTVFGSAPHSDDFNTLSWIAVFLKMIAGFAMLYQAYLFYRREERKLQNHVFMICAVAWSLLDLVNTFIHHTTVASISAYVFDILFAASLTLFLLYYARFTAGLIQGRQRVFLMIFAACTLILGSVSTIPQLFCRLVQYQGVGQYISLPSFSTLALTVFAGWISFVFIKETLLLTGWSKSKAVTNTVDCEYQYETVRVENLFPKKKLWEKD